MADDRKIDRRVRRTRASLHEALGALVHEKPFDDIAVKEILARADVGRTTFYAHFRDKESLLASATRELLRAARSGASARDTDPAERVLRFSGPLFEHVAGVRRTRATRLDAAGHAALHEHLRPLLVTVVADEVRHLGRPAAAAPDARRVAMPTDLIAQHVADTFLRVLRWWAEAEDQRSAGEIDALFRALVLPVVRVALGAR